MNDTKETKRILSSYERTNSIKETAAELGKTVIRIRRELITEEKWTSRRTEEIKKKYQEGKKIGKIAEELGISPKTVQNYLPYKRGKYEESPETEEATRSYNYRKRMKATEKKQKKRNREERERKKVLRTGLRVNLTSSNGLNFYSSLLSAHDTDSNRNISSFLEQELKQKLFRMEAETSPAAESDVKHNVSSSLEEEFIDVDMYPVTTRIYTLHCELDLENTSIHLLREYGKVKEGISRDIVVPGTVPLSMIHFMLQRAFGWHDVHIHSFSLSDAAFQSITDNSLSGFLLHTGELFFLGPPGELPYRDYRYYLPFEAKGKPESIRTWLKRQYNLKTLSDQINKGREIRRNALENALEFAKVEFPLVASDLVTKNIIPCADPNEVPVKNIFNYIPYCDELLEAATLDDVFRYEDNFLYHYDPFGDKWRVTIKQIASIDAFDIIQPYCDSSDGLPVMEDIGGISGYAKFLADVKTLKNEDIDWYDAIAEGTNALPSGRIRRLAAARDKGWTGRRISPKYIL